MIDKLLNDIDVLSEFDREYYQRLHYIKIEAISQQGNDEGAALIDNRWIPKSQLRSDFDKNIYVSLWYYGRYF